MKGILNRLGFHTGDDRSPAQERAELEGAAVAGAHGAAVAPPEVEDRRRGAGRGRARVVVVERERAAGLRGIPTDSRYLQLECSGTNV